MPPKTKSFSVIVPLILIISLFFLWGVANNLNDILIKQFKKAFTLTDFQSVLVQSAFYIGYFLLALPASVVMRRFGYKTAVVIGLGLYAIGAFMFYPAAQLQTYGLFLTALFVIASGLAFLETSANPLMTVLGDPAGATQRLNFAQSFNSLGAISGALVGRNFILSGVEPSAAALKAMSPAALTAFYAHEAHAVQTPYIVLGLIVLGCCLVTAMTRFPSIAEAGAESETTPPLLSAIRQLAARPRYVFGVVSQFFYVGAQVGIWSLTIRYAQHEVPGMGEKTAAAWLTGSLVAFMIGRFGGWALMGGISPARLMGLFGAANVVLMGIAALVGGTVGLYALAASSLFMSIMFPTIFSLSLRDLGPLTKTASSFLIMSIIGGALLPLLMGHISDLSNIAYAMLVPGFCFLIITLFGFSAADTKASELQAAPVGAP